VRDRIRPHVDPGVGVTLGPAEHGESPPGENGVGRPASGLDGCPCDLDTLLGEETAALCGVERKIPDDWAR